MPPNRGDALYDPVARGEAAGFAAGEVPGEMPDASTGGLKTSRKVRDSVRGWVEESDSEGTCSGAGNPRGVFEVAEDNMLIVVIRS